MRPIKFRAWNKNKLVMQYNPPFGLSEHIDNYFNGNELFEFMQFTGLLDKNGKEIYEGDLCRIATFQIGEIFFDDGRFQVRYAIDSSTAPVDAYYIKLNSYEVIGNIYENPELLNK